MIAKNLTNHEVEVSLSKLINELEHSEADYYETAKTEYIPAIRRAIALLPFYDSNGFRQVPSIDPENGNILGYYREEARKPDPFTATEEHLYGENRKGIDQPLAIKGKEKTQEIVYSDPLVDVAAEIQESLENSTDRLVGTLETLSQQLCQELSYLTNNIRNK